MTLVLAAVLILSVPPGFNDCSDHLAEQHAERMTICVWPQIEGDPPGTRNLEWNAAPGWVPTLIKHRIRYSEHANFWCANNFVEVPVSACQHDPEPPVNAPRCIFPFYPTPPWELIFQQVNTVNASGVEVVPPGMVIGACPP